MKDWIVPILAAIAAAVISTIYYGQLPDQIAIHFDISGEADNWLSKPLGAYLMPLLIIGINGLVYAMTKLETNEAKKLRNEARIGIMMSIVAAALLMLHLFMLAYNLGYSVVPGVAASIIIGFLFIALGNTLPRLYKSSFKWPSLPEKSERKIMRFTGRLMMVYGVLFLLIALLPSDMTYLFLLPAIVSFVVVTWINIWRHREKQGRTH